jgi:signal peptidase I
MARDRMVRFRERKPLIALALSFFFAGMGQVYNGKLKKGILFLAASLAVPFLLLQLSVVGPGLMPVVLLALSLTANLGLVLWAALDAWKQAKRSGKNYRLKIYNKPLVYVLLVAGLNLLQFGRILDWRKFELLAAPYRTETAAMAPTILRGDLVLTDKRIDHSSENLGLRRGELVVLKIPLNKRLHALKRVIGLPGDEIALRGTELYVNGKKWTRREIPSPEGRKRESDGEGVIEFDEEGDSGPYRVFYFGGTARNDLRIFVPAGCCFVLGDNRDDSADSRQWGSIALDDIVAKARIVYFSLDPKGGVRWSRIGKRLDP